MYLGPIFARDAASLGGDFDVSASGDLRYRRRDAREAFVVEKEDDGKVHITGRKASDI